MRLVVPAKTLAQGILTHPLLRFHFKSGHVRSIFHFRGGHVRNNSFLLRQDNVRDAYAGPPELPRVDLDCFLRGTK